MFSETVDSEPEIWDCSDIGIGTFFEPARPFVIKRMCGFVVIPANGQTSAQVNESVARALSRGRIGFYFDGSEFVPEGEVGTQGAYFSNLHTYPYFLDLSVIRAGKDDGPPLSGKEYHVAWRTGARTDQPGVPETEGDLEWVGILVALADK